MSHNITIEGGASVRLPTAGKYCDRDIVITATGNASGGGDVLKSIVDRTIEVYSDSEVTEIGLYAFNSCAKLTTINLPSCTVMRNSAFQSCKLLANVNAPKVTQVGTDTFNGCCFATIDMPLLTSVSGRSFTGNNNLVRADFPLTTNVGTSCFQNCTALEFVRMAPKSINAAGFASCSSLKTLILLGSTLCTLANVSAFSSTPIASGTGFIYVPAALLDAYKAATNWKTYAAQFRALEDYTVDGTITGELDESKI